MRFSGVFGVRSSIFGRFGSQRITVLRLSSVWSSFVDYWTVRFSGESCASCFKCLKFLYQTKATYSDCVKSFVNDLNIPQLFEEQKQACQTELHLKNVARSWKLFRITSLRETMYYKLNFIRNAGILFANRLLIV